MRAIFRIVLVTPLVAHECLDIKACKRLVKDCSDETAVLRARIQKLTLEVATVRQELAVCKGQIAQPRYQKILPSLEYEDIHRFEHLEGMSASLEQPSRRALACSTDSGWMVEGTGCATDGANCLVSRDLPDNYGNNEQCSALPCALGNITASYFHTERDYDKLYVNGETYHGLSGACGVAPSSLLTWTSDGSLGKSGWKICLGTDACAAAPSFPSNFSLAVPLLLESNRVLGCSWEGVMCLGLNITAVDLKGRELVGHIPPELGSFPRLADLALIDNYLLGTIPPELGSLTALTELGL